ncbi:MAG: penicillin-binding protein 2 [Hyphomonadaceae bacterium]|nr:penicillin-binding protein 2 [Clostridia bacterium]
MQLVKGEAYRVMSEKRGMKSIEMKAPRGEIFDRYGRPLVTNRMGFTVQIQKTQLPDGEFHQVLFRLLELFEKNQDQYIDTLPISFAPFEFIFPDDAEGTKEKQWKTKMKLADSMDAKGVMEALKTKYKINSTYPLNQQRKLIGLLYEMRLRGFNFNTPFVVATDVNSNSVMQIEERHLDFQGVFVMTEPIRQYTEGSLAAHVLGRVGIIYEEEYQKLRSRGYGMTDIVGKDGMEKQLESDLRGENGMQSISQTLNGKTTEVLASRPPKPGKNIVLTIDANLQKVAEQSLAKTIQHIQGKVATDADSGAVVVLDVNTGEVLAMASYPYFDPSKFNEQYSKLIKNPSKPMLNRAIAGAYPPASTFKMLTGIAALEENVISATWTLKCQGLYKLNGEQKRCWIYNPQYGMRTHGVENIETALRDSCNYFFYDVGRQLGIDRLEQYGKKFGLGEATGIELQGEEKGLFAGKTYRARFKQPWWPGETLSAAIGQMHMFTPIQQANYISTLANGGTRYKLHIVKRIKANKPYEDDLEKLPEPVEQLNLKKENIFAIREGMRQVTQEDGTASSIFRDFPIPVAGKTGTAEVANGSNNGGFVGFAPYENPQIAVAVVIEHGKSGGNTAPVVRDIFEAYFHINEQAVPDRITPQTWAQ